MPPSQQLARPRVLDDSRSDASSVANKDRLSTMSTSGQSKSKRVVTIPPYPALHLASIPHLHRSSQNANSSILVESVDSDLPRIPWHDMSLKDLHNYRQAHRLSTPSSQINPQAHSIFANAARKGVYSPGVVAARRKQREQRRNRKEMAALKERSSSRLKGAANAVNNILSVDSDGNGKQTREQLAMTVRKHFNAMSVSEGDVVARFTYVVRQIAGSPDGDQDKGFRMRFKP